MEAKDVLEALESTGALLNGHFELRSGLHSDKFFQCANALRYPKIAEQLCEAAVRKMSDDLGDIHVQTVIAPALGGIIVGHEVARSLDARSIFAEKEDGNLVLRRFKIKPGERVVVAEDVVTRGGRVQETIDIVEKCGGVIVAVVLLVDRSGGKVDFKYPTYSLLQMEPVTWEPEACPLCKSGSEAVHPGS